MSELIMDAVLAAIGGAGGGDLVSKTVTENKTYRASDDGHDGYSQVIVQVPLERKTINANGDYWYDLSHVTSKGGWYNVTVSVPSTQQPFQFSDGSSLEDITPIIDPDDTVLPSGSTQYIPHVYLAKVILHPDGSEELITINSKSYHGGADPVRFTVVIDITDADTGLSISGYPRRINPNWNGEVRAGGVVMIDKWTIDSQNGLKAWWHYRAETSTHVYDYEQYAFGSLQWLGSYTTDQAFRVNNPASNNS